MRYDKEPFPSEVVREIRVENGVQIVYLKSAPEVKKESREATDNIQKGVPVTNLKSARQA